MPSINLSQQAYDELKKHFSEKPQTTVATWTVWNLLEMKPEYTASYLFEECKKLFPCYSCIDLSIIISDRTGEYEITYKPNVEADEKHKYKSANDLRGTKTITLEERLLLEFQYFKMTGGHLDINNITLCAGSRDRGGCVPGVCWYDRQLYVYGYGPDRSGDGIRTRTSIENV